MTGRLLSFRLDPSTRRRATEQVLGGPRGPTVRSLVDSLEPGAALAALLVEHSWALVLDEAIGRMGGSRVMSELAVGNDLVEALGRLVTPESPVGD
jgi:hypothetical protein